MNPALNQRPENTLDAAPGCSAEARLILLAASVGDLESRRVRAESLCSENLDWDYLEKIAMANGMAAALIDFVKPFAEEFAGQPGYGTLKQRYYETVAHNLRLKEELLALLAFFETEAVDVMPLKGPVLAAELYPGLAHRAIWDLDLLVEERDVLRVHSLLESRGYTPEIEMTESELRGHLEADCEVNFDSADGQIHVEIHWNILPSFLGSKLDGPYVWNRRVEADFEGQKTWALPPEELLLYLCMHGGEKHQWSALKWVADVARLLARYPELDFDRARAEAARLGLTRSFRLGLYLARVLLDAPLPEKVSGDVLSGTTSAGLSGLVRGHLFRPDGGLPGYDEWCLYWRAEAEHRESLGVREASTPARGAYYRSVLTPEWNDRVFVKGVRLPSPLLYFVRPWRLFRIHGSGLFKRTS